MRVSLYYILRQLHSQKLVVFLENLKIFLEYDVYDIECDVRHLSYNGKKCIINIKLEKMWIEDNLSYPINKAYLIVQYVLADYPTKICVVIENQGYI